MDAEVPRGRVSGPDAVDRPRGRVLAGMVDISAVQAPHTDQDVRRLAAAAHAGKFLAAHVLPTWAPLLVDLLSDSAVRVGAPVGFPSGGGPTPARALEAAWLCDAGVDEVDVVIPIGRLRAGDDDAVLTDLAAIVAAVAGRVPIKAILETAHLNPPQIRRGTELALEAGVDALKTGTGWAGHATSAHEVTAIRDAGGPGVEIKASGGIRSLADVDALRAAGATRFGMNTAVALRLTAEDADR
ncbi:deoxyribose-phosphate aldolase [Euzebya sp.]|uniref:deoxyribose-phosphate aldolase n=1 Tax=Euzebya sp. TaxID=1971409 RepID=UPI0035188C48